MWAWVLLSRKSSGPGDFVDRNSARHIATGARCGCDNKQRDLILILWGVVAGVCRAKKPVHGFSRIMSREAGRRPEGPEKKKTVYRSWSKNEAGLFVTRIGNSRESGTSARKNC